MSKVKTQMSTQATHNFPSPNESLLPKAIPKVEYDPRLADIATVEIDAQFFGQLMASHKVSEEEIAATTIFATADTIIENRKTGDKGDNIVNLGTCDPITKTVRVSITAVEEAMRYVIDTQDPSDPLDDQDLVDMASFQASETTGHEIGHRIAQSLGLESPAEARAYYTDKLPEKRLGKMIRGLLRKSRNPAHHELANTLRQIEVGKMVLKGSKIKHEDYQESPAERFADSVSSEALALIGDADPYPVKVSFKKLPELLAK